MSLPSAPPPAFLPPAPGAGMRMSASRSQEPAPSRSPEPAPSPAMRALVAAWLLDASGAPPPPAPGLLARIAAVLRRPARRPSAVAVAPRRRPRARVAARPATAVYDELAKAEAAVVAAGAAAAGGGDVLEGAHSGQCMSALCSSLYSKFAAPGVSESFASLPFMLADSSAEGRGLLEAMRETRAKALSAGQQDGGGGGGLGRLFGGVGSLLLLLNPLK